jgi:hypothetical protein
MFNLCWRAGLTRSWHSNSSGRIPLWTRLDQWRIDLIFRPAATSIWCSMCPNSNGRWVLLMLYPLSYQVILSCIRYCRKSLLLGWPRRVAQRWLRCWCGGPTCARCWPPRKTKKHCISSSLELLLRVKQALKIGEGGVSALARTTSMRKAQCALCWAG